MTGLWKVRDSWMQFLNAKSKKMITWEAVLLSVLVPSLPMWTNPVCSVCFTATRFPDQQEICCAWTFNKCSDESSSCGCYPTSWSIRLTLNQFSSCQWQHSANFLCWLLEQRKRTDFQCVALWKTNGDNWEVSEVPIYMALWFWYLHFGQDWQHFWNQYWNNSSTEASCHALVVLINSYSLENLPQQAAPVTTPTHVVLYCHPNCIPWDAGVIAGET